MLIIWQVLVVCREDIKKPESDREFMCDKHNDNVFHVLGEVNRCKKNLKRREWKGMNILLFQFFGRKEVQFSKHVHSLHRQSVFNTLIYKVINRHHFPDRCICWWLWHAHFFTVFCISHIFNNFKLKEKPVEQPCNVLNIKLGGNNAVCSV